MKRTDPQREYAAFISYRHVSPDKEIAKILQFLLEYNLVRPNKQVPRHIRKVFLDVSELPTLEDLDAGILQALDKAECLFVICSPDLPESKYCMREISYFKEKHGGSLDRVATLLVRGDPRESYPELLRTKQIPDPQDPSKTIQVEVEPLYADVRAKTLLGSVWKLVTTEYLRLACRYFRCSYDVLKKRHKRNAFSFLLAALVLIGCVTGLLAAKEQRVQQTVADSYGAYAAEQTRADNELLALALCTYTDCKDTESYRTALRSAVVQLDHKQRNQPVAKMLEAKYFHGAFTHYFLSSTENKLVVSDDNVWQIIDAHNGAVLLQLPCESAFVLGAKPDTYVMLESHPDEQGIFRDYVVLTELETDRVIAEIPFRESSGETPEYDVITNVETGEPEYMQMHHLLEDIEMMRASASMPFCSKMVPINGKKYLDGGISDSIPVRAAMKMGYDKLIVVLTQPASYRKGPMNPHMIKAFYRKYPNLCKTLLDRHNRYNAQCEDVMQLEREGKIFVIRPQQALDIKRLEKDPKELERVRDIGFADGEKSMKALKAYLGK